jgi:hypothetical protein
MPSVQTVESFVKIVALIVGGWWTWSGFVRKRLLFPSANVEHHVTMWRDVGQTFIHLSIRIINNGNVLMRVEQGCAWVEQLTPLPQSVEGRLGRNEDYVLEGQVDAEWGLIKKRDLPKGFCRDIEPGETDQIDFDFVIDQDIRRVLIYSHLANRRKMVGGWNLNTIHQIPTTL